MSSGWWLFMLEGFRPSPPLYLTGSAARRYRAAVELIRLDERQAAVDGLQQLATDLSREPSSRLEAMQVLAQLDEADIARPLLRGIVLDPDAPPTERLDAEIALVKCGWTMNAP
jgi:hypothetical protein